MFEFISSERNVVPASGLTGIYRNIDPETVICIEGNTVIIWHIEGDQADELMRIDTSKSEKTPQQIADILEV